MFGIGMPELIMIMVVALVIIGPQKFPEMLRSVGRGLAELKRATNDIKSTVEEEMNKVVDETELKEVKDMVENDFGGVVTDLNKLTYSSAASPEDKLETIANAFAKPNVSPPPETVSTKPDAEPSSASVESDKPSKA
ncbi:MAG: twin-arginine translocase subunit TatB [SAR324 cluster bacterium]|nr:twin-arginine translocase subunit TatB [SAR324 cluster bacterium]